MTPFSPLQAYARDHVVLLRRAAEVAGFADPVAVNLNEFSYTLLRHARKGPFYPVEGVLIRDWSQCGRSYSSNVSIGIRTYEVEGIKFALAGFVLNQFDNETGYQFAAVDRKDYLRFYRTALKLFNRQAEFAERPVLDDDLLRRLHQNTLGYLDSRNLKRIRELGGRPKRGILLSGPPGNGKTSACRWLWSECIQHNWEYRSVSADAYAEARKSCGAENQVRALFSLDGVGVIVFDDFDMALRDRDSAPESDDQSVFLNALDGVRPTEGVVYVFTTNCPLERIDRAFRRPGRIDVVLTLNEPNAQLRGRLIARWHPDVRDGIDAERAVASTAGFSFADLEEVKNQLIIHYLESGVWDWDRALEAFAANRQNARIGVQPFGFGVANGRG